MIKIAQLTLVVLVFGIFQTGNAQQLFDDRTTGAKWEKNLRIRGLIKPFDNFFESKVFEAQSLISERKTIPADAEYVRAEYIARTFWSLFKDSLQVALDEEEIDIYSVKESTLPGQEGIFLKGEKISYNELKAQLSENLSSKFTEYSNNKTRYIYNIETRSALLYDALQKTLQSSANENEAGSSYLVDDLSIISLYEVEFKMIYNETGFRLKPLAIYFTTAHWDAANMTNSPLFSSGTASVPLNQIDPEDLNGFSGGFSRDVGGFMIDLREEKTYNYLVQKGVEFSGETNIVPFYDLLTLFHYDFKVYAESKNVLAESDRYKSEILERQLKNRYNEMVFTYLYGQPPSWWSAGQKGAFTNGMFKIDSTLYHQNNQ